MSFRTATSVIPSMLGLTAASVLAIPLLGTAWLTCSASPAEASGLRGTLDSTVATATTLPTSATGTGNGVLGTGVTVGTTSIGSGLLGTGLAVDNSGTDNGALGSGVVVNTTGPGQGVLGTGVTLGAGSDGATTGNASQDATTLNLRLTKVTGAIDVGPLRGTTTDVIAAAATGVNALAVGSASAATGVGATAIGAGAQASGNASVAVGVNARAEQANTIAIGVNARTTRVNQVAIGTTTNTYTMAGLTTTDSRSAQSGPTSFVTTDAAGNLAASTYGPTNIAGLEGRVGSLETSVAGLQATTARLQRDVRSAFQGTAIAMSLAGAVLPEGKNFAVSANFGTYHGETGLGASAVARLTDNLYASGGVGFGVSGRTSVGGRGGLTLAW